MRSYFGFQTVKKMYFCVNEKKSVNTKCPMNVYEFCRGGGGVRGQSDSCFNKAITLWPGGVVFHCNQCYGLLLTTALARLRRGERKCISLSLSLCLSPHTAPLVTSPPPFEIQRHGKIKMHGLIPFSFFTCSRSQG